MPSVCKALCHRVDQCESNTDSSLKRLPLMGWGCREGGQQPGFLTPCAFLGRLQRPLPTLVITPSPPHTCQEPDINNKQIKSHLPKPRFSLPWTKQTLLLLFQLKPAWHFWPTSTYRCQKFGLCSLCRIETWRLNFGGAEKSSFFFFSESSFITLSGRGGHGRLRPSRFCLTSWKTGNGLVAAEWKIGCW